MSPSSDVFLSARIPTDLRNRFKVIAAQQGRNLQSLLTEIIGDYVQKAEKKPPQAADIIQKIRTLRPQLDTLGVSKLGLVGSVARGDATADSDIDVLIDPKPKTILSLVTLLEIKQVLSEHLGHEVDVALRSKLKPDAAETMLHDEIAVF